MKSIRIRTAVAAALTTLVAMPALASVPAEAASGEVIRQGSCSGSADWKLKAKHRDGRLEVEFEIDANRNGQRWAWTLRHNGSVSARGVGWTRRPSGSFSRERTMVNLRGTDRISLYARNRAGQWCSGYLGV